MWVQAIAWYVQNCNKSSSSPTLHCCQTVNTRNTRNLDIQKKLILCSLHQIQIRKLWLPQYRGKITELNQGSPATWSPHPWSRQIRPTCFLDYHQRSKTTQTQTRTLTKPIPETTLWNPHQKKKFQMKTSTRNKIWNGHWQENGSVKLNLPKPSMEAETNLESSYRLPKFTLASTRKYMMTTWRRLASSITEGQAEAWADQFVEEAWTQHPGLTSTSGLIKISKRHWRQHSLLMIPLAMP